jgi:hypothetical protein
MLPFISLYRYLALKSSTVAEVEVIALSFDDDVVYAAFQIARCVIHQPKYLSYLDDGSVFAMPLTLLGSTVRL